MTTSTTPSSTVVFIQGTFDVARARNILRLKIAQQGWTPFYQAKAAAALTALGELILSTQPTLPVLVKISRIDQADAAGIKLSTQLVGSTEKKPIRWEEHTANLKRAAETSVNEWGDVIDITVFIRVE